MSVKWRKNRVAAEEFGIDGIHLMGSRRLFMAAHHRRSGRSAAVVVASHKGRRYMGH